MSNANDTTANTMCVFVLIAADDDDCNDYRHISIMEFSMQLVDGRHVDIVAATAAVVVVVVAVCDCIIYYTLVCLDYSPFYLCVAFVV